MVHRFYWNLCFPGGGGTNGCCARLSVPGRRKCTGRPVRSEVAVWETVRFRRLPFSFARSGVLMDEKMLLQWFVFCLFF